MTDSPSPQKDPRTDPDNILNFISEEFPVIDYLVKPLIPGGGSDIFMHGETGIGKSPLIWNLAIAIATGKPFMGYETTKARVAILDNDSPPRVVQKRLQAFSLEEFLDEDGNAPAFSYIVHPGGFDITAPVLAEDLKAIIKRLQDFRPNFLVINTLRKAHKCDDKDSSTPALVYGKFRKLFPGTTIFYVHHDAKENPDPKKKKRGDQAFSGSQHWADDVTVGFHLTSHDGKKKEKGKSSQIRLTMTKNQMDETENPIVMKLSSDGSHLSLLKDTRSLEAGEILLSLDSTSPNLSRGDLIKEVAEKMGLSRNGALPYIIQAEKDMGRKFGQDRRFKDYRALDISPKNAVN